MVYRLNIIGEPSQQAVAYALLIRAGSEGVPQMLNFMRFQITKVTLIALFFPICAFAGEGDPDCFAKEIDYHTGRRYQNRQQWDADRELLAKSSPKMPANVVRVFRGYRVGKIESVNSKGIGSDKRQHCYVGCRIADEEGFEVAEFAAYYKENKDIEDCNPKTHYDQTDIAATLLGAKVALKAPVRADAAYCRTECRKLIKK